MAVNQWPSDRAATYIVFCSMVVLGTLVSYVFVNHLDDSCVVREPIEFTDFSNFACYEKIEDKIYLGTMMKLPLRHYSENRKTLFSKWISKAKGSEADWRDYETSREAWIDIKILIKNETEIGDKIAFAVGADVSFLDDSRTIYYTEQHLIKCDFKKNIKTVKTCTTEFDLQLLKTVQIFCYTAVIVYILSAVAVALYRDNHLSFGLFGFVLTITLSRKIQEENDPETSRESSESFEVLE